MSEYSRLDRALHWLALESAAVRQMSFDIERISARPDLAAVRRQRHVLIAGLARAGTSVLLRMLAGSGEFAVQTYRDMPFVLAPSLWQRLSRRHRQAAVPAERAHRDGLEVDYDTVEAFEEVFWLTHASASYLRADHLLPHTVDAELADRFAAFAGMVVASRPGTTRYLSKNNNNVLRLPGIAASLPRARLLVPFRDPVQQALSLRRQHLRFCASQKADPFGRRYMGWLGHFEFGLDHRPFRFPAQGPVDRAFDPGTAEYWLELWTSTYAGVMATAPPGTVFWDYDAFCAEPARGAAQLAAELELAGDVDAAVLASVARPAAHQPGEGLEARCLEAALKTHEELRERAGRGSARDALSAAPPSPAAPASGAGRVRSA